MPMESSAFQRDLMTWGLITVIIPIGAYDRWLANIEPAPRDLLVPPPSEPMTMGPIGTRVTKPDKDDATIVDRIEEENPELL